MDLKAKDLNLKIGPMQLLAMGINIYWLNKDGIYLGCNQSVLKYLGITENNLIGCNNNDLLRNGIADKGLIRHIDESNRQVLQHKQPLLNIPDPLTFHRTDHKPIHYVTHRFPLVDSQGKLGGILGMTIDISEKLLVAKSGLFGRVLMASHFMPDNNQLNTLLKKTQTPPISKQEAKCLYYLLRGKSAREIGLILCKSTRTIEGHLDHVKQKLFCSTRSELFDRILNDIELIYAIRSQI